MNEKNFTHYKDQKQLGPVYVNRKVVKKDPIKVKPLITKPILTVQVLENREELRKERVRSILGIKTPERARISHVSYSQSTASRFTSCGHRSCRECTSTCIGGYNGWLNVTISYS